MTDQPLPLPGGNDAADENAVEAMKEFKEKANKFVEKTGLTKDALGKKLGYPGAKVSLWTSVSPYQAHLPRVGFVEALAREAQKLGNVKPAEAEEFIRDYGSMLQLYCARKNPHPMHVAMLTEYKTTLVIHGMSAAMNEVKFQEARLRAELEALRDDRNGQRERRQDLQRQLEELSWRYTELASNQRVAAACRDQAQTELTAYEADQAGVHVGPEAPMQGRNGLGPDSSYANHLLPSVLPPGPPPHQPPAIPVTPRTGPPRRWLVLATVATVLALVGSGVAIGVWAAREDGPPTTGTLGPDANNPPTSRPGPQQTTPPPKPPPPRPRRPHRPTPHPPRTATTRATSWTSTSPASTKSPSATETPSTSTPKHSTPPSRRTTNSSSTKTPWKGRPLPT
ncbi:hypothetical protein LUX05_22330 [Streptomyces somaliensis]|nr:hypothetical protein [Streptomyces somaliensis]